MTKEHRPKGKGKGKDGERKGRKGREEKRGSHMYKGTAHEVCETRLDKFRGKHENTGICTLWNRGVSGNS